MALAAGTEIGPYRVEALLGAGGMGEVYRATDTRLDRIVAIKVLPASKQDDSDRRHCLMKEAKAVSALQHPHIVAIHDVEQHNGCDCLVFEHVRGRTLHQLIPSHGMRTSEVLRIAVQIADALAAAHRAGIIHRDLKPGNVMVGEDGNAKLLDFGLALAHGPTASSSGATTVEQGVISGTLAYMSPEQAEGKPLDHLTDVFSFGVLLYEMITGRQPFARESAAATLSAVLRDDPAPIDSMRKDVPRELSRIVHYCLRKEPASRLQSMADLRIVLEDVNADLQSGPAAGPSPATAKGRRKLYPLAGLAVIVVLSIVAAVLLPRHPRPAAVAQAVPITSYPGEELSPTLSPDGSQVAFAWAGPGAENFDIYVKVIGTEEPLRLTADPTDDLAPAWSTDGRFIAFLRFYSADRAALMLIPALGGRERKLTDALVPRRNVLTGLINNARLYDRLAWVGGTNWLVYPELSIPNGAVHLTAIEVQTGEKHVLTTPEVNALGDYSPAVSPDGRSLAFIRTISYQNDDIYLLELGRDIRPAGPPRAVTRLSQDIREAAWSPDGSEILFCWGTGPLRSLWRVARTGKAEPLRVEAAGDGVASPAVSSSGRLVFARRAEDLDLFRLPLRGKQTPQALVTSSWSEGDPQYSPDGRNIAFQSTRSGAWEVWIAGSDGSQVHPLTSYGRGQTGTPRWSPDSRSIAYDSNVSGSFDIYVMPAEGGATRRLTDSPVEDAIPSWSQDGRWVYFHSFHNGRIEIFKVPANGGETILVTRNGGFAAFESPDGKSLYFIKSDGAAPVLRMPVAGGPEEHVIAEITGRAFVTAASGVYFLDASASTRRTTLYHYRYATGETRALAVIPAITGQGLTVSPDEEWAVFPIPVNLGSDLYMIEKFR